MKDNSNSPTKPRRLIIAEHGERLKSLFENLGLNPLEANAYGGFAAVYFATREEAEEALQYFITAGYKNPRIAKSYTDKGALRAFAVFADSHL